jgi:hypothetical protein
MPNNALSPGRNNNWLKVDGCHLSAWTHKPPADGPLRYYEARKCYSSSGRLTASFGTNSPFAAVQRFRQVAEALETSRALDHNAES